MAGWSLPVSLVRVSMACAVGIVFLALSCGGSEPVERRPNLLLVSLDSVRRDLPSCYGGGSAHAPGVATSPWLDRLAEEGVRMERAFSTTSWTLPSHLSLFTGAPELVHGVDFDTDRVAPELATLAETLGAAGYRTAGFFSGPYLEPVFGMGRGFERYESCYGDRLQRVRRREDERAGGAREPAPPSHTVEVLSHRDRSSEVVTDAALAELEGASEDVRPWMLFVHYFDPHYDYAPPAPYDRLLDPDYAGDVDGVNLLGDPAISVPDPTRASGRRRVVSDRDLEHVRALYAGELAWTDAQLGRLFERLAELDLEQDTLVVVLSDHGDEFFEHEGLGHRNTLYDEVLAVPLILRWPGRLPAGRAQPEIVSLADVAPSVLELLGVDVPPTMAGRSFAPLLSDAEPPVAASAQPRTAFGRIVSQGQTRFVLGGHTYDGLLFTIRESFRTGSIEIFRTRNWVEPLVGLASGLQDEFAELQERVYRREELTWIDSSNPAAPSRHFEAPRVRAALDLYRAEHGRLVGLRRGGERVAGEVPFREELEALGYATASGLDLAEADWLVLPPPRELQGQ